VSIIVGGLLYDIPLVYSPWVLLVLPLTGLSLAAIGMAIGTLLSNLELIVLVTNILLLVLLMGAPVFIPLAALPLPLRMLSYLLPPSYAADALRLALDGTITGPFFVDITMLVIFTIASLSVLGRRLRWRTG
ncbi:MAG TPA: ABC transporter permease, partial [Roseiflexaceae bacterium]|nr:ABC transporter permease [Roseiflexaceae bacterium]